MADLQSVTDVYRWVIEDVISNLVPEFENAGIPDSVITMIHQVWSVKMHDTMLAQLNQVITPSPAPALPLAAAAPAPAASVRTSSPELSLASPCAAGTHPVPSLGRDDVGLLPAPPPAKIRAKVAAAPAVASVVAPATTTASEEAALPPPVPEPATLKYVVTAAGVTAASAAAAAAAHASAPPAPSPPAAPHGAVAPSPATTPAAQVPVATPRGSGSDATTPTDDEDSLDLQYDDRKVDTSSWENLAFCLFEKVKTRRKFLLSGGVMYLNGRDYLFRLADAEFELQLHS